MWHYIKDGETQGPVSPEQLIALLQSGGISRDTQIWTEGQSDWVPVSQTEFQAHIPQQPVAAPKAKTKPTGPLMPLLVVAIFVVAAAVLVFALLPKSKTTATLEKADDTSAVAKQPDTPAPTFDEQYKRANAAKVAKQEETKLEDELQRRKLIRPLLESAEARGDLSIEDYLRRGEEQLNLLTNVSQSDEFREAMKEGPPVAPATLFAALGFAKFRLYRDLAQFAGYPTAPFDGDRVTSGATADDPFLHPRTSTTGAPMPRRLAGNAGVGTANTPPLETAHLRPELRTTPSPAEQPKQEPPPATRKPDEPFAYITKPLFVLLRSHAKVMQIGDIGKGEGINKAKPQLILVSGQFGLRGSKGSFLTFKIRDEWKSVSVWANTRLQDEDVCQAYGRNMPFTMSLQDLKTDADDWSKQIQVIGFLETNGSSEPIISLVMYQFD